MPDPDRPTSDADGASEARSRLIRRALRTAKVCAVVAFVAFLLPLLFLPFIYVVGAGPILFSWVVIGPGAVLGVIVSLTIVSIVKVRDADTSSALRLAIVGLWLASSFIPLFLVPLLGTLREPNAQLWVRPRIVGLVLLAVLAAATCVVGVAAALGDRATAAGGGRKVRSGLIWGLAFALIALTFFQHAQADRYRWEEQRVRHWETKEFELQSESRDLRVQSCLTLQGAHDLLGTVDDLFTGELRAAVTKAELAALTATTAEARSVLDAYDTSRCRADADRVLAAIEEAGHYPMNEFERGTMLEYPPTLDLAGLEEQPPVFEKRSFFSVTADTIRRTRQQADEAEQRVSEARTVYRAQRDAEHVMPVIEEAFSLLWEDLSATANRAADRLISDTDETDSPEAAQLHDAAEGLGHPRPMELLRRLDEFAELAREVQNGPSGPESG